MKKSELVLAMIGMVLICASGAFGHLDTLMQVMEGSEVIKVFEGEDLPGIPEERILVDERASGGMAVLSSTDEPVFELDLGELEIGAYAIYVVGRVPDETAFVGANGNIRKPLYFRMDIDAGVGGEMETHILNAPYETKYEWISRIYFNAPERRNYSASVSVAEPSRVDIIIDRLELRDELDLCELRPVKSQRIFYTEEEVLRMRQTAVEEGTTPQPLRREPLAREERDERDDIIWNQSVMPLNSNPAQIYGAIYRTNQGPVEELMRGATDEQGRNLGGWMAPQTAFDQPWIMRNEALDITYTLDDYKANKPLPEPWPFREHKGGYFFDKDEWGIEHSFVYGIVPLHIQQRYHNILTELGAFGNLGNRALPMRYLLIDDHEAAADAAFLIAAYAYRYPSYDWNNHCTVNIFQRGRNFQPGSVNGRGCSYSGWSTGEVTDVLLAYDMLFPYIQGNEELARRVGRFVPWVETPDDVVALIDTWLVQRAGIDGMRYILYSPSIPWSAVILGPNDVSERILDRYFSRVYLRDTMSGFRESIINGYSRDGLNYIGSTYYTVGESVGELQQISDLLYRYVRAGGDERFNVADPAKFPRLSAQPKSIIGLHVAGGFSSNFGDVADPQGGRHSYYPEDPLYSLRGWQWSGKPEVAWMMVNRVGRGPATDEDWERILADAENVSDPMVYQESRILGGFGLVVMEEGRDSPDFRDKRTVTVRTGVGSGHAHPDTLDIQVWANGVRMAPDIGGRFSGQYGRPSSMSSKVHNLVEVDETDHTGGPRNSTGTGWVEAFKPMPGAQFTLAAGFAETHPQVDTYRRAVALVNGEENGDAYVFDVFRVAGGNVHTWCFHGGISDDFSASVDLAPAETEAVLEYLHSHQEGTKFEGGSADILEGVWRIRRDEGEYQGIQHRNAEALMMGADYDPESPRKFTRVALFGHPDGRVMVGNFYSTARRQFSWPFLYLRNEADVALETVYPAIIEPYAGEPFIASNRRLAVEGGATGADAPVALEVVTAGGRRDILFSDGRPDGVREIEGGFQVSGDFAIISSDDNGARLIAMTGGSLLSADDIVITKDRPAYETSIESVDYENRSFRTADPLPAALLDGQELTIFNDNRTTHYTVDNVEGELVRVTRTASLYEGPVSRISDEGDYAVLEVAPYLYDYHPLYYEGATAVNEAGNVLGKVSVERGDRFMYLGWPEVRRHLQSISWDDIPDADGDGRRTLHMFAADAQRRETDDGEIIQVAPGEKMFELEVVRISEDGDMIWYNQHPMSFVDSIGARHRGWPYHNQILRNEDATRQWESRFPGDTYNIRLDKGNVALEDFPDIEGDERRLMRIYDYGPGDMIRVPTHIYMKRVNNQGANVFEIRADVALTIEMPGEAAEIGDADGEFRPLPTEARDGKIIIRLTEKMLGDGFVMLKVAP